MTAARFELGNDGPSVIVVGLDGSDTSLRAGSYALGLARRQGARLVAVFVRARTMGLEAGAAALDAVEAANDALAAELRELVTSQYAAATATPVELVDTAGDAFTELTRVAEARRADAVVVGASTKAGHRLVGSTAVRLVRAGRWPVTVVP